MSSYTIPYSALATEVSLIKIELMRAVENVLNCGRYVLGPEMVAFEREFAESVGLTGAKPVFVDICDDGNMDTQRLESAITERTHAIVFLRT